MRTKYSKNELIALSKGYFENHPSVDVFHVTDDSMFFTNENRAEGVAHARTIDSELFVIERGDEDEQDVTGQGGTKGENPSDKWNKKQLTEYMSSKGIVFGPEDTKAILLERIAAFVPAE